MTGGTARAGTVWTLTTTGSIIVDTTTQTWTNAPVAGLAAALAAKQDVIPPGTYVPISGAGIGGAAAADQTLKDWTTAEAFELTAITRDANDVATTATVKWPDGSGGTFTSTTINASFNTIDAYTVSHTLSGKTVTQAAVTRNANGFLVTQNGGYLLGSKDGAPAYLKVPNGASNMTVSAAGEVTYVPAAGGARESAGFLTLAKFANEGGLERASTNLWRVTGASGPEVLGDAGGLPGTAGLGGTISGVVEMSNVDLATEFTELISAQRGFQANSRVISTSDEMLNELVNLKR